MSTKPDSSTAAMEAATELPEGARIEWWVV